MFLFTGMIYGEENEPRDLKELQLTPPNDPLNKEKSEVDWLANANFDFTQIGNNNGYLIGIGGAIIFNGSFLVGAKAYGLMNSIFAQEQIDNIYPTIGIGYGGLWIGYRFFPKKIMGFTLSSVIGVGGLNYSYRDENQNLDGGQITGKFTIAPELSFDFNITRNFTVSIVGKYLYFAGAESYLGFSPSDLSGFNVGITLQLLNYGKD